MYRSSPIVQKLVNVGPIVIDFDRATLWFLCLAQVGSQVAKTKGKKAREGEKGKGGIRVGAGSELDVL